MTKMFLRVPAAARGQRPVAERTDCQQGDELLGRLSRLTGQKRSPLPPAMMMTKRSFVFGLAFIVYLRLVRET